MENWTLLLTFVGINMATAVSGAVFMPGEWYKALDKPWWTPPNWLFGPAWTVLYVMIAYSGYRFVMAANPDQMVVPLTLYGVQFIFNSAWSGLFFGLKRIDLAFVDAILMFVFVAATIVAFHPVSPLAAGLLVPYLLWVAFASALNYSILRKNSPVGRTT